MSVAATPIRLLVKERRELTPHICEFTLVAADGGALPRFEPGAHVTLETPSGAMRRYSLVNNGTDPDRYVIAIKREPNSRGGSVSMHERAVEGTELVASEPENTFPLLPAPQYLLIAGGIGVTPVYAMARHLKRIGSPFRVIYCTRTAADTAYLEQMTRELGSCIAFHHDDGDPAKAYDFWDHFAEPSATHVYCCGPAPLMEEIKAQSGHWPEGRVHFEDFKPVEVVRASDVPFRVRLSGSERVVEVPAHRSILEALRDAGIKTASSCESGTCGTCRCRLIEGDVDHRDIVLMDEQKDTHIVICVSRARQGDLVIEL